jgi:hypothetical protein
MRFSRQARQPSALMTHADPPACDAHQLLRWKSCAALAAGCMEFMGADLTGPPNS